MATIDGHFLSAVDRFPHRCFLRQVAGDHEASTTYARGAERIAATVEHLRRLGLAPGDRAVLYLDEVVSSIQLMLACAFAGVTIAPLAPSFSLRALKRLYERTGARGIVTTPARASGLSGAIGVKPICYEPPPALREEVHAIDTAWTGSSAGALEVLRRASDTHGPDDPYIILSTSGSTGEPKLVVRSHNAVAGSGDEMLAMLDLRADEEPPQRLLMCSGLTHGMAQRNLACGLSLAAELSVPEGLESNVSRDQICRLDPTLVMVSPRVLRALEEQRLRTREPSLFGPSIRLVRTSGSAADLLLLDRLAEEGVDVGEACGASEVGPIAVTPRRGWRRGTIGQVMPSVMVRISDHGEILVKTPYRMLEYLGDPQLTAASQTEDGFYRTGDLGHLDSDRYLQILGRKHDTFNAQDGTNIHPARLEALIEALPWVQEAILAGDQRPFVVALIVIAGAKPSDAGDDGFLDARVEVERYARAAHDLARINQELEAVERIRRFALFARAMPRHVTGVTPLGKPKRDRRALLSARGARIEMLYRGDPGTGVVP